FHLNKIFFRHTYAQSICKTGRIIAQGPIGKSAIISIFPRMASDSVHYSRPRRAEASTLKGIIRCRFPANGFVTTGTTSGMFVPDRASIVDIFEKT
ncbi:MAG: hypothetical protein AB2637_13695, partial [Candidatus Thiodiazotropha sp.]